MADVKKVGMGGIPDKGWTVQANASAPPCGSWKEHWLKSAGTPWPAKCSITLCKNAPSVAVVVKHPDIPGSYIIPTCGFCAKRTGEVSLEGGTVLVSAF